MFPKNISALDHLRDNKMIAFKTESVAGKDVIIVSYMIGNKELWDDPLARECRGITFDAETGDCICTPFEKFFNVGEREETQEHVLPWNNIKHVYEKRDGSMLTPVLIDGKVF
jgi:tRNA splicing ligase